MQHLTARTVKIFFDGADRATILAMASNEAIQGFTTNPSLMRKSGVSDYGGFCRGILELVSEKPISFELFADDLKEMHRQALEIHGWGKNVYVKVPITNSEGVSCGDLIRDLTHDGVKVNVTAVLSLRQVLMATEALKGGAPSIVSVFAGRIADTGRDPIPLMQAAVEICRNADEKIETLWASTREALNIVHAEKAGCDIITVSGDLLAKTALFGKDLDRLSLETVRMFKTDADAAGYQL